MAGAETVAVLLPGAFYYLSETRTPPVGSLREHGVPMALATDANHVSHPRELAYWIGTNPCRSVIKEGVVVGP